MNLFPTKEPDVRFALTLRALPNWRIPPEQRLRAALKALLRHHGLRCISARPVENSTQPTAEGELRSPPPFPPNPP